MNQKLIRLFRVNGVIILFAFLSVTAVKGQITGEDPPPFDSVMIFQPAVPLLSDYLAKANSSNALGLDLVFSGSGWGAGFFYQRIVLPNVTLFANTLISGRRNTDEFENVWLGQIPVVAGKLNRLFMIPTTVGLQYRLFSESLQETFRPFVAAGFTPTYILSTPYIRGGQYYEFFRSFAYGTSFIRMGGSFALGANFGDPTSGSMVGVQLRYYVIPFGGEGLESMQGSPIKDFGGMIISLSVGSSY